MVQPTNNTDSGNFDLPLPSLLVKAITKFKRISKNTFYQVHDQLKSSHLTQINPESVLNLAISNQSEKIQFEKDVWLLDITNHFLNHRFDLLGSGWTRVFYGMNCRGLEGIRYHSDQIHSLDTNGDWINQFINKSNTFESRRIWNLIIQPYEPIDWQLDFKSGYRWHEKTWFSKIKFGHEACVDIKVPWELARMQHLPLLAKAFSFSKNQSNGFATPEVYVREFQNQILDFIATNPPRWGVNWSSTMDVSIRIINWLLAFDLFSALGAKLDESFIKIFSRSVYEHAEHISNHLEWHPKYRNNHYFSNIVGLVFAAAYLPVTKKTNSWLNFSINQLINETKNQFNEDGSNFEASTCYHRLSSEFAIYATALVLGLPAEKKLGLKNDGCSRMRVLNQSNVIFHPLPGSNEESPFPGWYFEKLEKMAEFTQKITKPDGQIPQIGDNDSGRLLKLFPIYHKWSVSASKEKFHNLETYTDLPDQNTYWMEDFLDHRNLVSAINGLFDRPDFQRFASTDEEESFIELLSYNTHVKFANPSTSITQPGVLEKSSIETWQKNEQLLNQYMNSEVLTKIKFENTIDNDSLDTISFPDFGLFIFRSKEFYLAIRCGTVGQHGNGGHAHNDQLSIELYMNKKNIFMDPGTYLYTPSMPIRNTYRSANAHFVPRFDSIEPSNLSKNIFSLSDPKSEVLYFGRKGFIGSHEGYGFKVYRKISISDFDIIISDYSQKGLLDTKTYNPIPFSPGYGIVMNTFLNERNSIK